MKKAIFFLFLSLSALAQTKSEKQAFTSGEWLRYKMSYSGFLRAGTAELSVEETEIDGKKVFHTTGKGWTTGMIKWFFKVEDDYQSYFDKDSVFPYLFKRKINEGGYKKHVHTTFNHDTNKALVQDFLKQKDTLIDFKAVQDMLSSFYFLRNLDVSSMKPGDEIKLDMFLDAKTYNFKLRYIGNEDLKIRKGRVKTMKFVPLVQAGRIFKEKESVTIWITADDNKIPIKLKANLAVGSLRAELEAYKGLAHSFKKIYN
ncbi:MAG: ATP-dependent exonuclease [Flavobacteriaceae bacterium]|nr:ATP-dependent exonuclease [Flavobacteriaceae bacterium]